MLNVIKECQKERLIVPNIHNSSRLNNKTYVQLCFTVAIYRVTVSSTYIYRGKDENVITELS